MRAGRWSFEQILSVLNHSSLLETKAIPFDSDMLKAAFSGGGVCTDITLKYTDMNMNEKFTGRYLYVNMNDPGREEVYVLLERDVFTDDTGVLRPKDGVTTSSEIDDSDYSASIKYLANRGLMRFIKKMPLDVDGLHSFLTKENKVRITNSNYKNEKLRKRLEKQAKLDARKSERSRSRKRKFDEITSTAESSSSGQNQYPEMETHNIPIESSFTSSHHDSNTATSSNASAGTSSPCGSKSSRKNMKKKQRAKRHAIQTAKGELKVKLDKLSALKKRD